jgi:hypothetical protein
MLGRRSFAPTFYYGRYTIHHTDASPNIGFSYYILLLPTTYYRQEGLTVVRPAIIGMHKKVLTVSSINSKHGGMMRSDRPSLKKGGSCVAMHCIVGSVRKIRTILYNMGSCIS